MVSKPRDTDLIESDNSFDSMIDNGTDESESEVEDESESEVEDESESKVEDESETEVEDESGTELEVETTSKKNQVDTKRKIVDPNDMAPKKKCKTDKELYKAPTVEELNQLRETENLFHSNLFRLQIEEMLLEVRVKEKYKKLFRTWFDELKECIVGIEETEEQELSKGKSIKNLKVKVPLDGLSTSTKGYYKFMKPSNIKVIGSYAADTCIGPNITVDVAVEIPAALFQKHDYQNHRYIRKRAIYSSYIAANITADIAESKTFVDLGDNYKPILKLVPSGKLSKHFTIHLYATAAPSSFKLNRFLPSKNSVRSGWYFHEDHPDDDCSIPTPHYNSSVLYDLTLLENNSRIIKTILEYPALRDGILLLKIWLRQRQLDKGYGAFTGHIMTMYVIYLIKTRKLNTVMSSYQVVRNVWNSLAQSNWCESGITLCQAENGEPTVAEYQTHYDCVFIDFSGYHNFTANMNKTTYNRIRSQAELAVKCLDNVHINSFQALFMTSIPFHTDFDNIICFPTSKAIIDLVRTNAPRSMKLDYGSNQWAQAVELLVSILQQGLNRRVSEIAVKLGESREWKVTDDVPEYSSKIYIGLKLNPEFCFTIVDKGPQANWPEAEQFRTFWGKKSELRRFQDGTICEATVWGKGNTIAEKRSMCKRIATYLLEEKLSIKKDQFLYISDQMEQLLKLQNIKLIQFAYGTGEEASLQIIKSFSDLEKQLTSLSELPLTVTGVQGNSAVFRYTEVFPPLGTVYRSEDDVTKEGDNCLLLWEQDLKKTPPYVQPICATIQLSLSGKWPDELEAVRKIKAAFHIQIAEGLRKQFKLKAQGGPNHIHVLKDGFVFRLTVVHQKEIILLKEEVGDDGVRKYRENNQSIELEKKMFHLPKLTSALHGLHSQQPSFGPACCLAKRWLSAHLLDDSHIPNIVVELLVASLYLAPEPYTPTQTPQVAFLRFLKLFVKSHWHSEPIIVNFNNEMNRQEIVEVESHFNTNRDMLPSLFISTPYDQQNSIWSKKNPTLVVLNRITTLARESLKIMETQIDNGISLDFNAVCKPPLTEYDFLINLRPLLNSRRFQAISLNEKYRKTPWHPYKPNSDAKIPVVDFDPVQLYLQDLRENYEEYVLFFHDTYGGNVIGVLLKPNVLEPKDFKVSNVNCRKVSAGGKLILNVSAMLEDFYILGKGLVDSIEIKTQKDIVS